MTSYDIPQVVLTLDPNGALLDLEVPEGVTFVLDRVDDAGETETQVFEGPYPAAEETVK